jgi:hypothetical protein
MQAEISELLNTFDSNLVQMYLNGMDLQHLTELRDRKKAAQAQQALEAARAPVELDDPKAVVPPKALFRPHKKQISSKA